MFLLNLVLVRTKIDMIGCVYFYKLLVLKFKSKTCVFSGSLSVPVFYNPNHLLASKL